MPEIETSPTDAPRATAHLRADARRNRERILASAGELFALHGRDAQMEQIAVHAGLGMGTLYRHFPNKHALLTAIVRERFARMADVALAAEAIEDPREAWETIVRDYLEAADGDAAFQLAIVGSFEIAWDGIEQEKLAFRTVVSRIIDRAVAAGTVRADLHFLDFPVITCGIIATMYFRPSPDYDWRRHLDLVLTGIRRPE